MQRNAERATGLFIAERSKARASEGATRDGRLSARAGASVGRRRAY